MPFRPHSTDNTLGNYHIPVGFACIAENGSLRPVAGSSRKELHCAICQYGPFRGSKCLFADCSAARARAKELSRERQGNLSAICKFPKCGELVHYDSILCPDHQSLVFSRMARTGETYEQALGSMSEEYELEEALC